MGKPSKIEILAIALVFSAIVLFPIGILYINQTMFLTEGEIQVTIKQWQFTPNEIHVKKGQVVRLSIASEDVYHGFQMADYGINTVVKPGEPVHIEFKAEQVGEFFYRCFVPCGDGHSIIAHSGKFIVEEEGAEPGNLRVIVKDSTGNVVQSASVAISGPKSLNGVTDQNGQFVFTGLFAGNYLIQVTASGYGVNATSATVSSGSTTEVLVMLTAAVVKEFHIDAYIQEDGGFSVQESSDGKTIAVNKGDTVRLIVTARDVAHSLVIHDFEVDTGYIAVGKTFTVEFTATAVGTFTYDCMIYCSAKHPDMIGTLIVNP